MEEYLLLTNEHDKLKESNNILEIKELFDVIFY